MLELILGEKELISTFDVRVYSRAVQALQKAGIRFRTKATPTGSGSHRGSLLGSLGERVDCQTQYQVFVKKGDYDRAAYCSRY